MTLCTSNMVIICLPLEIMMKPLPTLACAQVLAQWFCCASSPRWLLRPCSSPCCIPSQARPTDLLLTCKELSKASLLHFPH